MNIDYHKWYSSNLSQDMELKSYGHAGKALLVYPAQGGRFFDYENFGMIDAIYPSIEAGRVRVFTVDSLDNQTWANAGLHPGERGKRHEDYDRYITQEVIPFVRQLYSSDDLQLLATGVSMGAYHAANFFFRHPDLFDGVISLSGLYHLRSFVGDYMDDYVYFNSPLAYLPELQDQWYLQHYRCSDIVICCGQGAWEDDMLHDTLQLRSILHDKDIPAWVDLWGLDVNHDWPWWTKMMPYFLEKLGL